MGNQGLWYLVNFPITASTEECHPKVLPHMGLSSHHVFIHYPTVGAEGDLFLLIGIIGDRDPVQTLCLVEFMDHRFLLILKLHIRENNSDQRIGFLLVEHWLQTR